MKLLHEGASPETLRGVRLGVLALWLVKVACDPLEKLAALPAVLFHPIGLLRLIPAAAWRGLFDAQVLLGLRALTIVFLLLSLFLPSSGRAGTLRHAVTGLGCLLLILIQGLTRSVGYINHAELALLYCTVILALAPLVDRFAPQPRSDVPLILMTAVLCFSYALAGMARLLLASPAVFHPDTLVMWTLMKSHEPSYYGVQIGRHILEVPAALRVGFSAGLAVVTAFEVLAPCCLLSQRFRLAFLAVMVPFHLTVFVTMNILFWETMALYPLLLVDRDGWLRSRSLAASDHQPASGR
jgi:hypothetical protein